ncbi:MAG: hypothetical protein A2X12_02400 [Bacteroidetes bacterium GWE2_29_8]|nr:MAG: hypothetical protein A2X12_02400 [Bacteroidetes bacterium GWE2_29_8]OFY14618.1 MAG: hypothetical protein A2X02_05990 [Bacteroidetes bacterium GWF2_29_10]
MDLTKVLSISGYSGLFSLIGQTKNGVIVESLDDKKRFPVYASKKISVLEDIAIYTNDDMIPLKDVIKKIFDKENGNFININIDKETEKIKAYFEEILPDYDKTKVYTSDIKKIIKWYNLMHKHNLLNFEEKIETEPITESSENSEVIDVKTTKKETKKPAKEKLDAEKKDSVEETKKKKTAKKTTKDQLSLDLGTLTTEEQEEIKPKRKSKKKEEE